MRITILFIALCLLLPASGANGVTLVKDGKSDYSIIISEEASPSEIHGARELQSFLQQISGAFLPVRRANETISGPMILVGNSTRLQAADPSIKFDELGKEGFVMKLAGNNLILAGGRLRGSMYAVYTFLEEKIGCRWYSSTVSKIPEMKTITVEALNQVEKPAFEYRDPFWYDAFDGDWSARNKCNGSTANLGEERGGKIIYEGVHTFNRFVPHQEYFENHPEYFSVLGTRRTFEQSQLCLTNPEVRGITRVEVHQWMEDRPEIYIYGVGQNDYRAGACECKHCALIDERERSHAGTLVNFVNAIAEYVEKDFPDKMIGTLAYHYTVDPPRFARPRKNVNIRLCHMTSVYGCDAHPIEDCSQNDRFAGYLRGWHEIADHIYIWDYKTNFQHYLLPKPSFFATKKDAQFFRKNGVDGVFQQGAYDDHGGASAELQAYIDAKLLWNPDRDLNEVINDFLEGYYGPAAKPIRKYYDLLYNKIYNEWVHFPINPQSYAEYLSPAILAQADLYFDEAEELTRSLPDFAYRVEAARLWIRYAKLARPVERIIDGNLYKPAPTVDARECLQELDDFLSACRRHDVNILEEYGVPRADLIRANYSTFRTVRLENELMEADVLPELGGRILRIRDKKSGVELLRLADPESRDYPAPAGYTDGVISFESFDYSISQNAGETKLVMTGYGNDNALFCTKEIILRNNRMELEFNTRIDALSDIEGNIRISPAPQFDFGNLADVRYGFKSNGNGFALQELPGADAEGNFRYQLWGAAVPAQVVSFINQATGMGVINVFGKTQIEGLILSGSHENNTVSIALQGIFSPMKKGESKALNHKYVFLNSTIKLPQ